MPYARQTSVPAHRSRAEIEALLIKHGAEAFAYASEPGMTMMGFRIESRAVRMTLPMPSIDDYDISHSPTGKLRSQSSAQAELDKELRRVWRSLLLVIKAKLVAVEDGISTIEREFMADLVLQDGRTMNEAVADQLAAGPQVPLLGPAAQA